FAGELLRAIAGGGMAVSRRGNDGLRPWQRAEFWIFGRDAGDCHGLLCHAAQRLVVQAIGGSNAHPFADDGAYAQFMVTLSDILMNVVIGKACKRTFCAEIEDFSLFRLRKTKNL